MQVTLHSTDEMVEFNGTRCRVWQGKSAGGIECFALIPFVGTRRGQDNREFLDDLRDQPHQTFGTKFDLQAAI